MLIESAKTDLAPGCFGRALTYKAESAECSSCKFAELCGPRSIERTNRIREELGLNAKPAKAAVPKIKKTEPHNPLFTGLPVKVVDLLRRFERAGIRLTDNLRNGTNPIPKDSVGFMRVACHLLLKRPEGLDRRYLRSAFMQHFGWTEGTAAAHAAQACQVLVAVGAVSESNGVIQLRK